MTDLPFLIAGGGIAGLAVALGLADRGGVRLFEQAPAFEEVGAGLQMSPNGIRALQALGAWDCVAPSCVAPSEIHVRDGLTARILQRIRLGKRFAERFGAPYQVCHRADLLAGLLAAARQKPSIELNTGVRVSASANGAGATIRTSRDEMIMGRAVIAADGIRSGLRQGICGEVAPVDRGHMIYRALVPARSVPAEIEADCVTLWLCPGGHVVHYPVSNWQRFNIVAVAEGQGTSSGWGQPQDGKHVLRHFPAMTGDLASLLQTPRSWLGWQGADLPELPRWSNANSVLVGDAAHATLPFLAQGAVMALEDACQLSSSLALHREMALAFRHYESQRKPRTSRIQRQSRNMGRIYHLAGLSARARNLAFGIAGPSAVLRQTSWIYDWKP